MRLSGPLSLVAGLVLLAGCAASGSAEPGRATTPTTSPTVSHESPAIAATPTSPVSPVSPATPSTAPSAPAASEYGGTPSPLPSFEPDVAWTDAIHDGPFTIRGIAVVSKAYPLPADYVPPWSNEPNGLHPDARAAFDRLTAAAAADGRTLTLRSGYRSYAEQAASFANALRTYDEATARLYFAEPGKSEHQTGLALDAWDGRNRGTAFAQTPEASWLAEHAWEYGFLIRYPQGKTHITGYAWESWHLRWVGEDVARAFGPNSTLTLEEYLGLA